MVTDNGIRYPSIMPAPQRLANGDVVTYTGAVLPFAASCAPGTSPDPSTMRCEPFPNARNINYECGGALVPPGAPGCEGPPAFALLSEFTATEAEMIDARPDWLRCNAIPKRRNGNRAACAAGCAGGSSGSSIDPKAVLFVFGVAIAFALMTKGAR